MANSKASKICFASIDVEQDFAVLKNKTYKGAENLREILDIFMQHNVFPTLFITGEIIEKYPYLTRQWSDGCEIGCHSFTHRFWNTLSQNIKEQEIEKFRKVCSSVLQNPVNGFRSPSHIIDEDSVRILSDNGFLYDSSVVPHYPFFKRRYRGYERRSLITPFYPSLNDCRVKGNSRILEIPVSGQMFGIPLAGAWISGIPFSVYKFLFAMRKPSFITLSVHSWDILKDRDYPESSFARKLDKLLRLLRANHYEFLSGENIYELYKNT